MIKKKIIMALKSTAVLLVPCFQSPSYFIFCSLTWVVLNAHLIKSLCSLITFSSSPSSPKYKFKFLYQNTNPPSSGPHGSFSVIFSLSSPQNSHCSHIISQVDQVVLYFLCLKALPFLLFVFSLLYYNLRSLVVSLVPLPTLFNHLG